MSKTLWLIAALSLSLPGCDSNDPVQPTVVRQFVTTESDNLTDAEEAELLSYAHITGSNLELAVTGGGGLYMNAGFTVWTEATVPFYIFFPRIKHDAVYQVTADGASQSPVMLQGNFDLTDGLRMEFNEVFALNCSSIDYGSLWVQSKHRARWNYFKLGSLLHIYDPPNGPITYTKSDDCPQLTTDTKLADSGNGGGTGGGSDGDPADTCETYVSTWFWVYDDGHIEIISQDYFTVC